MRGGIGFKVPKHLRIEVGCPVTDKLGRLDEQVRKAEGLTHILLKPLVADALFLDAVEETLNAHEVELVKTGRQKLKELRQGAVSGGRGSSKVRDALRSYPPIKILFEDGKISASVARRLLLKCMQSSEVPSVQALNNWKRKLKLTRQR